MSDQYPPPWPGVGGDRDDRHVDDAQAGGPSDGYQAAGPTDSRTTSGPWTTPDPFSREGSRPEDALGASPTTPTTHPDVSPSQPAADLPVTGQATGWDEPSPWVTQSGANAYPGDQAPFGSPYPAQPAYPMSPADQVHPGAYPAGPSQPQQAAPANPYDQPVPYGQPQPYPATGYGYGYAYPATPAQDPLAIASLVIGIASIFVFPPVGVVALIMGVVVVRRTSGPERPTGRGLGIAGIATGAVGILISIAFVIYIIWIFRQLE